jgi:beta-phosphoglucomutase
MATSTGKSQAIAIAGSQSVSAPNGFGVIFDVDGVLVSTYRAHFESWQVAGAPHGMALSEADFARTFGRTSREIIHQIWPGRYDDAGADGFAAEKEAAYRDIIRAHLPEMDGAADLIAALDDAGFLLALGSSGPPENVAIVWQNLTNGKRIRAAVNGMEVKKGKPDPEVFLIAARKLGLEPARCAVVEDAPVGLQAARRAGMVAVGLTGTVPREALAAHAHLVVDRLAELTPSTFTQLLNDNRQPTV